MLEDFRFLFQFPSVIELNVGGTYFTTRLSTLTKDKDSMLAAMFSGRHRVEQDSLGRYFIDRDGKLFHHVLTYLRHDKLPPPDLAVDVLEEAEYYQVTGLIDWCKRQQCVAMETFKASLSREEHPTTGDVLSPEILFNLVEQSVKDKGGELQENGDVDKGMLSTTARVIFTGQRPLLRTRHSSTLPVCGGCKEHHRPVSDVVLFVGEELDHLCTTSSAPSTAVCLVVNNDEVINPPLYVQRTLKRFHKLDPTVQIKLERTKHVGDQSRNPNSFAAHDSTCIVCHKNVCSFLFKFYLFP